MRKSQSLRQSFHYAFEGIRHCFRNERNIRIHFSIGLLVILAGLLIGVSTVEMAILCVTIAVVIGGEMVNTAMENVVDLLSPEYHPLAKIVKDVVAGTVLVLCFFAVIVGLLIFIPHLLPK